MVSAPVVRVCESSRVGLLLSALEHRLDGLLARLLVDQLVEPNGPPLEGLPDHLRVFLPAAPSVDGNNRLGYGIEPSGDNS